MCHSTCVCVCECVCVSVLRVLACLLHGSQIPGGQYTNLLFQSKQLGLTGQWAAIKTAYAGANRVLGDIVKVSLSRVVSPLTVCVR